MSNLKKFQPASATNDHIIAGKNSGVTVYCSSTALDTYNKLVSLGKNGNHWARLIVKGIEGLSSSRLSMDNVYAEKGKIAYGRGLFYVSLPGVMATFDALDNGAFKLTALNIDPNNQGYFQNQKEAKNPGLWRVKQDQNLNWKAKFVKDGRLLKKHKNRYVAISDTSFSKVEDAVGYVSASLQGINGTVKTLIENEGFDMHYTPSLTRPDGLVNSKQALNQANPDTMIKESAQLLAHTMYQARDNDNIQWFSDWGGSEVLTQAMKILTNQNVKLEKHTILLNHPTSRPSKALDLGRELGLTPFEGGGITRKGIPSGKEIIGRLGFLDMPISSVQRLFKGQVSTKQAVLGSAESTLSLTGTTVGTLGVLASVGVSIAGSPIVGAVGSAVFVTSLIIKAYKGRRKSN